MVITNTNVGSYVTLKKTHKYFSSFEIEVRQFQLSTTAIDLKYWWQHATEERKKKIIIIQWCCMKRGRRKWWHEKGDDFNMTIGCQFERRFERHHHVAK